MGKEKKADHYTCSLPFTLWCVSKIFVYSFHGICFHQWTSPSITTFNYNATMVTLCHCHISKWLISVLPIYQTWLHLHTSTSDKFARAPMNMKINEKQKMFRTEYVGNCHQNNHQSPLTLTFKSATPACTKKKKNAVYIDYLLLMPEPQILQQIMDGARQFCGYQYISF